MKHDVIKLELSKEEFRIILESLLFTCSVDITANVYEEDVKKMKDLAISLRSSYPSILTENVKVFPTSNGLLHDDKHTEVLMDYFPEIVEKF